MTSTPEPAPPAAARDYSKTLFLPQTEFPMRAGLPQREPELLRRWHERGLYRFAAWRGDHLTPEGADWHDVWDEDFDAAAATAAVRAAAAAVGQ
jgi:hypothetical protein